MIPTLEFLMPAANAVAAGTGQDQPALPTSSPSFGEGFGDVMARALSPDSQTPDTPDAASQHQPSFGRGPLNFRLQRSAADSSEMPAVKPFSLVSSSKGAKTPAPSSEKSDSKTDKNDPAHALAETQINMATVDLLVAIAQPIAPVAATAAATPTATRQAGTIGKPAQTTAPQSVKAGAVQRIAVGDVTALVAAIAQKSASVKTPVVGKMNASAQETAAHLSETSPTPAPKTSPPGAGDLKIVSDLKTAGVPQVIQKTADQQPQLEMNRTLQPGPDHQPQPEINPQSQLDTDRQPQLASNHQSPLENGVEVRNDAKAGPDSDGIHAAKMDITMKNAEKVNKIAGSPEKILPGDAVSSASKNNLPGRAAAAMPPHMLPDTIANSATLSADSKSVASAPVATASFAAVDPGTRTLERTHDMVVSNAMRLHASNFDSLRVVIKPDSGTQLSLELRQRGDGVDAQAILQHGDFNQFSQHWPELQQRLEQRGIRLAPLFNPGNMANHGQSGFQQHQQPARQEPLPANTLADFAPAAPIKPSFEPVAIPAAVHRGWESWA